VIYKPQKRGSLGLAWAVASQQKNVIKCDILTHMIIKMQIG